MRKTFFSIFLTLLLSAVLSSCVETEKPTVTVTLDYGYDGLRYELVLNKGDKLPDDYLRPSRGGQYVFIGWQSKQGLFDSLDEIDYDIELSAQWEYRGETKQYFTVTYHDYNGNVLDRIDVAAGEKANEPVVRPFKSIYHEFCGWDKDISAVASSMDVYPLFCYRETNPDIFTYEKTESGDYFIANAPVNLTGVLCLPRNYNGRAVVGIAKSDTYAGGVFAKRGLTNVYIPASYRYLGDFAFYMNESLNEIYFENESSLEEIGVMCFMNSSLLSLNLPTLKKNVEMTISTGAFMYNMMLKEINLCAGVKEIGLNAFYAAGFDYLGDKFSYPVTLTIPDDNNLISIGDNAFKYSYIYRARLVLPNLESIGNEAFFGSYIESLVFAELKKIGNQAFYPRQLNNYFLSCLYNLELGSRLTSIGDEAFYAAAVKSVVFPTTLQSIGRGAFKASSLQSLTLPFLLNNLGESVFEGCEALEKVQFRCNASIPAGAFKDCYRLTSLSFEGRFVSIGAQAFAGCAFETVSFPTSLKEIGDEAFLSCNNLVAVDLPVSLIRIGERVFANCTGLLSVSLTGGLNSIAAHAFENCTALNEVVLPQDLQAVGDFAFYGCFALSEISFPEYVSNLGISSFSFSGLKELVLPTGIEIIGDRAFEECNGLKTVTIPRGTLAINFGEAIFNKSVNLESIIVESGNAYYSNCNGDGHLYNADGSELIMFIPGRNTYYRTPETLLRIGDKAFSGNFLLQSLVIGSNVQEIGLMAFAGSDSDNTAFMSLKYVDFSQATSLKTIDEKAFYNCILISSLDLSNCLSLTTIGEKAFYNCYGLKSLKMPSSLKTIGASAFEISKPYLQNKIALLDLSATGIEYIGGRAFKNWSEVEVVKFPSTLNELHEYAFENCELLAIADLSYTGLTVIDNGVFKNTSLSELQLPSSVTEISFEAFSNTHLREVNLGGLQALDTIGNYAFYCNPIGKLTFPAMLTNLGIYAFADGYAFIERVDFNGCRLQSIAHHAFYNAGVNELILSPDIVTIGAYAFAGSNLTSLKIPATVREIGIRAFDKNLKLGEIQVGDNVNGSALSSLGAYAFGNCPALKHVFIYAKEPPVVSDLIFTIYSAGKETALATVKIYVPDHSYVAYCQSWFRHKEQVYMMSLYNS